MAPSELSDRGELTIVVCGVFIGLTTSTTALRIYSRSLLSKTFSVDDVLMILSLACFLWLASLVIVSVYAGLGYHIWELTPIDLSRTTKTIIIAFLGYTASGAFLRLSVGLLFLRLTTLAWQRYILCAVMTVVTAYSVAFFFVTIFACDPVSYTWSSFLGAQGKCMDTSILRDLSYLQNSLYIALDWCLALMPIALLWNSKLGKRTKMITCGLLGLGGFASAASIVRLTYLHQINETGDFTYTEIWVLIWSIVECGVGIIAANCATLRPLVVKLFGKLSSTFNSLNITRNTNTIGSGSRRTALTKRLSYRSETLSKRFSTRSDTLKRYSDDTVVEEYDLRRVQSEPPTMELSHFLPDDDFERSLSNYFDAMAEVDIVDLAANSTKGYGLID